jgi:hypothetical protein
MVLQRCLIWPFGTENLTYDIKPLVPIDDEEVTAHLPFCLFLSFTVVGN